MPPLHVDLQLGAQELVPQALCWGCGTCRWQRLEEGYHETSAVKNAVEVASLLTLYRSARVPTH